MSPTRPTDRDTISALRLIGRALNINCAWHRNGTFYFPLSDAWCLSVSPDSAGRFRLGACYGTTEVATLWALPENWSRLADLALSLRAEVNALNA